MVDFLPWHGDYTGTVVQNNIIMGGLTANTIIIKSVTFR
jgi:hypothetical protein